MGETLNTERNNKLTKSFYKNNPDMQNMRPEIEQAVDILINCFSNGGKVILCGNGGSFADAQHIAGELGKGFLLKRPLPAQMKKEMEDMFGEEGRKMGALLQQGLPCIVLEGGGALGSAFCNDVCAELVYAQQALTMAQKGDVLWGISTSGNAKNVCAAMRAAKTKGAVTLGMSGEGGGEMAQLSDCLLAVPSTQTYRVQEFHIALYHYLCAFVESRLFDE